MKKTTKLRSMFEGKGIIKVAGVQDGISAILGEKNNYDALWASGFGISSAFGLPDTSILTMTEFLYMTCIINKATKLPVIADCDTGFGDNNNVKRMVQEYESSGIAGVCMEDKEFPKRNSFMTGHKLASIEEFSMKIDVAKQSQIDQDFIVIARLESFIVGNDLSDALKRAEAYSKAGADAILIHSKKDSPDEVFQFAYNWKRSDYVKPLIVVPTTYYDVTSEMLELNNIKTVIYANQTLRASIKAMDESLRSINENGTTVAIEDKISTVKEVFNLVDPMTKQKLVNIN